MTQAHPEDPFERAEREGWADQIRTEADRRWVEAGGYFDFAEVLRVLSIIGLFILAKGRAAGKRIQLLDWHVNEIIGPLFGWRRPDGGLRYSSAFIFVPKKNAKTTLCAIIGLILLAFHGEAGAEVYSVARKRGQAAMVWETACQIIRKTPELEGHFVIVPSSFTIHHPATESKWVVLPKGSLDYEGIDASGVIVDELHVITDTQLLPALKSSGAARFNPLELIITTAGEDPDGTVWGDEYKLAKKIQSGEVINDNKLVVIYEADIDVDDPGAEETWAKANPSYGQILRVDEMRSMWADAQLDPQKRADFLRYRLNIPCKSTEGAIDLAQWDLCGAEVDPIEMRGRPCVGAFDLGNRRDMAAFCLLFAPLATEEMLWRALVWYWLPTDTLAPTPAGQRDLIDRDTRRMYQRWADAGLLQLTPGKRTDYRVIRDFIIAKNAEYKPKRILFDPWDATKITSELGDAGVPVVEFSQTMKAYAPACKELVEVVLPGIQLAHGGHEILRWNAKNLVWFVDNLGNRKPVKALSKGKVDGIQCLIMALGQAISMKDLIGKPPSRYARGEGIRGA